MTDEECREFRQRYLDIRSQLVLEITEQELLSKEALERKTSKGFLGAVALDDYGSGYNSEKSLLALSPKYIKVDMVIIRDIDTDIDKQQIVANIVKYAHQRGMYIVAEGVETAEELKKVLELEVDLLQGYYLSRPAATPGAINPDALKIIEEKQEKIKKKVGKSRFSRLFLYIFLPVFHIITIRIKDKQIKDTGGILEDESNGNCSSDR